MDQISNSHSLLLSTIYSCQIASIKILLSTDLFSLKLSQAKVPPKSLSSSFKKHLNELKSGNFLDFFNILPLKLKSAEIRPIEIIKYILEDFKSNADALYDLNFYTAFVAVRASQVIKSKLYDCVSLQIKSNSALFVEINWDIQPSCERVLEIMKNIEKCAGLSLKSFICAHGYVYSGYIKESTSWTSSIPEKAFTWADVLCKIITEGSYPVQLLYYQPPHATENFKVPSLDLDKLQELAKLQDSRISVNYTERFNGFKIIQGVENANKGNTHLNESYRASTATTADKLSLSHQSYEEKYGKHIGNSGKLLDLTKPRHYSTQPENFYRPSHENSYLSRTQYKEDLISSRNTYKPLKALSNSTKILEESERYYKPPTSSANRITNHELTPTMKNPSFYDKSAEDSNNKTNTYKSASFENGFSQSSNLKPRDFEFRVENPNKEQMPEIKFSNFRRSGNISPISHLTNQSESTENRMLSSSYVSPAAAFSEFAYKGHSIESAESPENNGGKWRCPKCDGYSESEKYECTHCRYINWERFYVIKSKTVSNRGASFPTRPSQASVAYKAPTQSNGYLSKTHDEAFTNKSQSPYPKSVNYRAAYQ